MPWRRHRAEEVRAAPLSRPAAKAMSLRGSVPGTEALCQIFVQTVAPFADGTHRRLQLLTIDSAPDQDLLDIDGVARPEDAPKAHLLVDVVEAVEQFGGLWHVFNNPCEYGHRRIFIAPDRYSERDRFEAEHPGALGRRIHGAENLLQEAIGALLDCGVIAHPETPLCCGVAAASYHAAYTVAGGWTLSVSGTGF